MVASDSSNTPPGRVTSGRDQFRLDFVAHLVRQQRDAGAMAALRRGSAKPPGTVVATFPYVSAWAGTGSWRDQCVHLVAAVFAAHQQSQPMLMHQTDGMSLGKALRRLAGDKPHGSPIERRFLTLLRADADALPRQLHAVATLLRGAQIRMDYVRLLRDLEAWQYAERYTQRGWARDFYARITAPIEQSDAQGDDSPGSADSLTDFDTF